MLIIDIYVYFVCCCCCGVLELETFLSRPDVPKLGQDEQGPPSGAQEVHGQEGDGLKFNYTDPLSLGW